MNEREFNHKVKQDLNYNLGRLSPGVNARLKQAREQALNQLTPASATMSRLVLSGFGHPSQSHGPTQKWLPVLVLLLALGSVVYWQTTHNNVEEDVDLALLVDDLPLNAILDADFHQWLEHSPQP